MNTSTSFVFMGVFFSSSHFFFFFLFTTPYFMNTYHTSSIDYLFSIKALTFYIVVGNKLYTQQARPGCQSVILLPFTDFLSLSFIPFSSSAPFSSSRRLRPSSSHSIHCLSLLAFILVAVLAPPTPFNS